MPHNTGDLMTIEEVTAREILDSRGNPTVQVEVLLMGGASTLSRAEEVSYEMEKKSNDTNKSM